MVIRKSSFISNSLFIYIFIYKGTTRITLLLATSILIEEAKESKISIPSKPINSQGRAVKAKGIEVKAPTGQISITLPESISKEKNSK